jgi:hypothetical protein
MRTNKFYYRPIVEQGMPSELTAAVLNLPRREGDGGANGASGSTPVLTKVNASAKPNAQINPTAPAAISITFLDGLLCNKKQRIDLVYSATFTKKKYFIRQEVMKSSVEIAPVVKGYFKTYKYNGVLEDPNTE